MVTHRPEDTDGTGEARADAFGHRGGVVSGSVIVQDYFEGVALCSKEVKGMGQRWRQTFGLVVGGDRQAEVRRRVARGRRLHRPEG